MKAVFLITLFLSFILIFSCRKENDEDIQISGKVIDKNQGTPVSGATVILSASKVQTGIYNPNYETVTSVSTSSNGAYSFDFKNNKYTGYRISVIKDQYFDVYKDYEITEIKANQTNVINLEILPQAFLNLRVWNVFPNDNQDLIGYHILNTQPGCLNCCGNATINGIGSTYDTTFTCKTYGHSYVIIQWNVKKGSQNSNYQDSVFCPAFQTTSYVLKY